jgi:hypothetical protein
MTLKTIFQKILLGVALTAIVAFSTGACANRQQLIEDTYTVQQGDSLWSVSEEFLQKNTGGRRYILEFKSGIKELNPWLLERPSECELYPGDILKINYFVKVDDE